MQRAFIFLIIIFLANLVGMYFNFYMYWWFDMSLHFLGGIFVAMFMAYYLADILKLPSLDSSQVGQGGRFANYELKKYLIIVGAVTFVGVMWEFTEYLASQTLIEPIYNNFGFRIYFIGNLSDTINDLLMDVLGALAWLLSFGSRTRIKFFSRS